MLHTKFHGNRPARFGEEDFEGFLPYMGMTAILVMRSALYIYTTQNLIRAKLLILFAGGPAYLKANIL